MVMICVGPLNGSEGGQMLVMDGVWLSTVAPTAIFCDFVVTAAPEATTVMLAVYGVAEGVSAAAFTVTLRVANSPGKTIPTVGETISHVAPAVAENEIGAPFVDRVTVWAADGLGGAVNVSVAGFNDSVEGASVTFNVTATTEGAAAPVTVIVMADTYCPTGRLFGFTLTLSVAGSVPLSRFTFNQKSVPGVEVVKSGLPALARIETVCALGSVVAPD